jgi:DNA replication protein DnaD
MDDSSKVRLGKYEIIINKRRNTQYVEGQKSATSREQSTEDHKEEKEVKKKRRENGRVYSPPECMSIKTCSRE